MSRPEQPPAHSDAEAVDVDDMEEADDLAPDDVPRTRAPWSIERRIVLGVVALVALVTIIVGAVSVLALRQSMQERLDEQVMSLMRASLTPHGSLPDADTTSSGLLIAVSSQTNVQGVMVTGPGETRPLSPAQLVRVLSVPDGEIQTLDVDGIGGFRVQATHLPDGTIVGVGLSTADLDATTWTLVGIFALVTGGVLVIAALGAIGVARVALRPLGRVIETASRVSELQLASGDVALADRVPEAEADPRTEVGQVGAALNRMLHHVEEALVARQRTEEKVRQFVSDASHELRTPLASIRGYAELTRRIETELPEGAVRSLDRIESESIRMTRLVEDLLELARLDEGEVLAVGEVELVRLLADAVGDAYTVAPEHDWELVAPDGPVIIEGDAARLEQVVVNLLANAHRHTPEGTSIVVTLTEHPETDEVELVVADDGPGIDPELQEHLFERFVRGDGSRSRATGSTGLGLAIASAVIEAHGGTIDVASQPGDTRFTVRLPRHRPAAPDQGVPSDGADLPD
ncbi:cell wall metabolism sensor histidine kinase WalK [Salinibacterium sp. ZJ70]|uniref:sensor histidine kinase n=1 Tax=Salinibacterium sp. ZJ70 TaxID=2708084 RepID=UPI001CD337B9|nr:HAMP domain-containing sensor histidine kinase [Salinibacterium sp. ZJ70]